ncbi:hypothetical protein GGI20_004820 [Coemansia sp. BCRC 34301]|nr:hypothetical protein GGI20_004820 [Coemansia sp. BCRC 34301]
MSDVDWFTYFLHPERLGTDFGPQGSSSGGGGGGGGTLRWSSSNEQRAAGVQVLRGLLSPSNFREYIISAYPTLRDAHGQPSQKYTGPTPPSTPKSPGNGTANSADVSHISRMAQCSRFGVSPATGLPSDSLSAVLSANDLPELSARQERLLAVSKQLNSLLQFDVEEVESAVHATIRFIYYLSMVPDGAGNIPSDVRFQVHRWIVRSAYREEDIGLSMEVERTPAMDASCQELSVFSATLDESDEHLRSLKFRVAYDLARVYLAQSRVSLALEKFGECQRIDPARCVRDKFALAAGKPRPSVNEYAAACTAITQSLSVELDPRLATSTPTDQLRNMYISGSTGSNAPPVLASESDYLRALEHCLTAALEAVSRCANSSTACSSLLWLACIHPPLLQYCAGLSADSVNAIKTRLRDVAEKWTVASATIDKINSLQVDEIKRQSQTIIDFITSSWPKPSASNELATTASDAVESCGKHEAGRSTIAEDQMRAIQTLELELGKVPLATTQLSYCYLSGLRLLEQEMYKEAQIWFAHGLETLEESSEALEQRQGQPSMPQQAEKDRALRLALAAQVEVHQKLADLLCQIAQGRQVSDLSDDIDAILETRVPIRFEFLEHLVLICLRQDNKSVFTKLVGTIATNQKLYQQLPEIHITLLQIASLLVVVRDVLHDAGIDIDRELAKSCADGDRELSSSCKLLSEAALTRLQSSVAEIALLLLKIPIGAKSTAAVSIRTTVGCVPQVGSLVENEIERFCRMWGDPAYLLLLGALLSEMLQRSSGKSVCAPLPVCELVVHIVGKRDDGKEIASDGEQSNDIESAAVSSIVQDAFNSGSEQGQLNIRHMRDIAFIVFTCAARELPNSACLWLYFSAVASGSMQMTSQFLALFIEYLSLQTDAFAPKLVDSCMSTMWLQGWLPEMIRSLTDLRMSGAAAVLHQCAADINYEAAISLLVRAFERGEMSQRVAEFFWDPNIIEYGQFLGRQPSSALRIEFPVPSAELGASKSLILSSYFLWMSSIFSAK